MKRQQAFKAVTVKFNCCGTVKDYNHPRSFSMCDCGASGYDAGDGFYARILGNPSDVTIIAYDMHKINDYCEKYDLKYYCEDNIIVKLNTSFFIEIKNKGTSFVLKKNTEECPEYLGTFTELKHARKRMEKLIREGSKL